jgi:hypothetical protein
VSTFNDIITIRTAEIVLAFSLDDGGLRVLQRIDGPNVLGHGQACASIDVRVGNTAWLARHAFVRYLHHQINEDNGIYTLEIVIGIGPLKIYDRYTITGTLIARTLVIQNVGDDPIQLRGVRLVLPWALIGALASCRFEAPGTSVRPHVALSVAAEQREDVLPRRFFAPGLRDSRAMEAAPLFTPGLVAIHNPELDESLLCWYMSHTDSALPQIEGNGAAVTLQHEIRIHNWMQSEQSVAVGTQYILLMREAWPAALAAFQRTWQLQVAPVQHETPSWMRDAAIYETHPALFGGFAGMAAALPMISALGINTLCLLPIWAYGNGRMWLWDGSWQAATDLYALRDLDTFDLALGSPEQFHELIDAAHACGMRVLLDLPLLGCAPDSHYIYEQRNWFCRDEHGQLLEIPDRPGIIAFDWSVVGLREYLTARLIALLREYQLDGFRANAPRTVLPNWLVDRTQPASSGSMGYMVLLAALRRQMQIERPEAVVISDLAGPIGGLVADATIDELAHHMFVHTALSRITPAELSEWLEDHWTALPNVGLRICFTESHRTRLINPVADGLRGSRISRMLLAGIVLCGFLPSIWAGQERDEALAIGRLLAMRRAWPVLRNGTVHCGVIPCNSAQVFTILRTDGGAHAIGLLNVSSHRQMVTLSLPIDTLNLSEGNYCLHELISGQQWVQAGQRIWQRDQLLAVNLTFEPFGAYCLVVESCGDDAIDIEESVHGTSNLTPDVHPAR